ncbi:MAG: hypothetical protein DSY80_07135 [Desulfocapsa sp.]|nr:MAG: hypothetical protein DSY80_07135 [Desulfocapsa sp.]
MSKLFTLKFPARTHQLWDYVDLSHVLGTIAHRNFITRKEAIQRATSYMAGSDAIKGIYMLVLRNDDVLQLLQIGPRGGVKVIWTFGDVTKAREAMILDDELDRHLAI